MNMKIPQNINLFCLFVHLCVGCFELFETRRQQIVLGVISILRVSFSNLVGIGPRAWRLSAQPILSEDF